MTYTPDWAIETYVAVREGKRERKKTFEEADKVDQDKLDLLEKFLLTTMIERNEEQIKTAHGVAYKSPQMRATMIDRQAVIAFTLDRIERNDPNAFDMFTNHINKEEVKRLLDAKVVPPGVEIHQFVACNVRKA